MSEDLTFRYVTSSSYPTFTCAECGVALCAHAAAVISVLHKTAPAERAILTDLIAELRACPVLPATREDLEPLRNMADRAEERLRQITEGDA